MKPSETTKRLLAIGGYRRLMFAAIATEQYSQMWEVLNPLAEMVDMDYERDDLLDSFFGLVRSLTNEIEYDVQHDQPDVEDNWEYGRLGFEPVTPQWNATYLDLFQKYESNRKELAAAKEWIGNLLQEQTDSAGLLSGANEKIYALEEKVLDLEKALENANGWRDHYRGLFETYKELYELAKGRGDDWREMYESVTTELK